MDSSEPNDKRTNPPEMHQSSSESASPTRRKNPFLEKMRGDIRKSLFDPSPSSLSPSTPEPNHELSRRTLSLTPLSTGRENFHRIRQDLKNSLFCKSGTTSLESIDTDHLAEEPRNGRSQTTSNLDSKTDSKIHIKETSLENIPDCTTDQIPLNLPVDDFSDNLKNVSKTIQFEEVKNANSSDSSSDSSDSEEGENSEALFYPTPQAGPQKVSIFMSNIESEIQSLKEQLEVTNDPDVHFIKGDFENYYIEKEIIGEGTTGTVKKCMKKNNDERTYAVKIVHYRDDAEMLIMIVMEFKNHRKLEHRNIIRVYEIYIDYYTKKIYTIMELAECQEMFEVLKNLGHYSEAIASHIFKQILNAINYLHLKGVCHRDLKPNNILVSNNGEIVKIADFNVSKFIEKKGKKYNSLSTANYKMWTYTGTIAFTAPEVFMEDEYTESVDLWSAGVVLYTMLCGYQPFQAEYVNDLIELIKEGRYEFDPVHWDSISDEAKDLVRHLLDVNTKTRYSIFDALKHPWIANKGKAPTSAMEGALQNFIAHRKKIVRNRIDSEELSADELTQMEVSLEYRKRRSETAYNIRPIILEKSRSEDEGLIPLRGFKLQAYDTDALDEVSPRDEESPSSIRNKSFRSAFQIQLLGVKM